MGGGRGTENWQICVTALMDDPLLQIDDPLDAIPVHGAGGVWGTVAVHLFRRDGPSGIGLAWNLIGMGAIVVWTGLTCFIIFYSLSKVKLLRVETENEFRGKYTVKN